MRDTLLGQVSDVSANVLLVYALATTLWGFHICIMIHSYILKLD